MFYLRFALSLVAVAILSAFSPVVNVGFAAPMQPYEDYVAPGHDKYHHWYQEMQARPDINGGCCDEDSQDCGPVADYLDFGGSNVWVLLEDNNWHRVSSEAKIIRVATPDGNAHACRKPQIDWENNIVLDTFQFFCVFLPIPEGS